MFIGILSVYVSGYDIDIEPKRSDHLWILIIITYVNRIG